MCYTDITRPYRSTVIVVLFLNPADMCKLDQWFSIIADVLPFLVIYQPTSVASVWPSVASVWPSIASVWPSIASVWPSVASVWPSIASAKYHLTSKANYYWGLGGLDSHKYTTVYAHYFSRGWSSVTVLCWHHIHLTNIMNVSNLEVKT